MGVIVSVKNATVQTVVKSVSDGTVDGYDAVYQGHSDAPDNQEGPDPESTKVRRADSLDDPKSCTTD